jgi:quinol monooxygenase YgiN
LKGSRYSFNVKAAGDAPAPYYCVFEAEFADEAAMGAALQSPQGQAVVGDIGNYATIPPTIVHYEVKG